MSSPAPSPLAAASPAGSGSPGGWLGRAGALAAVGLAWSLPVSLFGMQLFAVLGALVLLAWLVWRRGRGLVTSPLDRPLVFLLVAIGLSLLLSPGPPGTWRTATSFWVLCAFWVGYLLLDSRARLRQALAGLLSLGCLAAGFCVFQSLTGRYPLGHGLHPQVAELLQPAPGHPGLWGGVGWFFSRLTLAHVLLFPLCLAVGLSLERLAWRFRLVLLAAAAVLLAGIVFTWTRAGLAAALVCPAVLIAARLRRGWPRRLGLLGLGALALAALAILPQLRGRLDDSFAGKKDWGRLAIWQSALDLTARNPLTGIGYGNFQRDAAGPIEQRTAEVGAERFKGTLAWAHNNLLTFLAETGALGLFAFCWLFVAYFAAAARLLRGLTADPLLRGFLRGSMAAVAAFLLVGMFHDTFFDGEVIFCLWFVAGASLAAGRLRQVSAEPTGPAAAAGEGT